MPTGKPRIFRLKHDFNNRSLISYYGFRKGPHLSLDKSEELYESLIKSPFVSLYGSQYRMEDLAELVTMYHLTQVMGYEYSIEVRAGTKILKTFNPMISPAVQERFKSIRFFYE